jgi:hypothetical protein
MSNRSTLEERSTTSTEAEQKDQKKSIKKISIHYTSNHQKEGDLRGA